LHAFRGYYYNPGHSERGPNWRRPRERKPFAELLEAGKQLEPNPPIRDRSGDRAMITDMSGTLTRGDGEHEINGRFCVFIVNGRATWMFAGKKLFDADDPLMVDFVRWMLDCFGGIAVEPEVAVKNAFKQLAPLSG
jgi:hypothetical protein